MGIYNDDDYCSCILFINNTEDRFIVTPIKYGDTFPKERWELPNIGHNVSELTPVDTTIWLAETYLHLKVKESNLRLIYTTRDDSGSKVHLFENNSLTSEINDLFENEMSKGWYQTMSYHQAGLVHSGLDYFQKEILAEANLIKNYTSPLEPHLKPVYSRVGLRAKIGNYSPKPL